MAARVRGDGPGTADRPSLVILGLVTIGIAVVINVIVWVIGRALVDPPSSYQPLGTVWPTVIFTALYLAIGVGVYALLRRRTAAPDRWFIRIATVAMALSFLPFFGLPGMDGNSAGAMVVLAVMHVVSYVVAIAVLTGRVGRR